MSLENLIELSRKRYNKNFKDEELKVLSAEDAKPADGLIVDNPLLEFLLDRRFLPYGRCYLIYGKKGGSKTSLFFDLAKTVQYNNGKNNGIVFWVETEYARDLDYAKAQGVDLSRLIIPDIPQGSLQQACTYIEALVESLPQAFPDGDVPVMICLDSIAGCIPDYELQDKVVVGETKVGEHARIMSSFYRRICAALAYEKCFFVALNQQKDKIGGMTMPFGGEDNAAEALIGGEAQRFHSTIQLKVSRIKDITGIDEYGAERKICSRHRIQCKRNKLGREGKGQEVEIDLYTKGGADWYSSLVRKLAEHYTSVVGKSGGWYKWKESSVVVEFKDAEGNVLKTSANDDVFRDYELGVAIRNSTDAKEFIRKIFGIPDMPKNEVIESIEKERKINRKKKKKEVEEERPVKGVSASPVSLPIIKQS